MRSFSLFILFHLKHSIHLDFHWTRLPSGFDMFSQLFSTWLTSLLKQKCLTTLQASSSVHFLKMSLLSASFVWLPTLVFMPFILINFDIEQHLLMSYPLHLFIQNHPEGQPFPNNHPIPLSLPAKSRALLPTQLAVRYSSIISLWTTSVLRQCSFVLAWNSLISLCGLDPFLL